MNRMRNAAFRPHMFLGEEDLKIVRAWYADYADGKTASVSEMVGAFAWIAVSNSLMREAERQDEEETTDDTD